MLSHGPLRVKYSLFSLSLNVVSCMACRVLAVALVFVAATAEGDTGLLEVTFVLMIRVLASNLRNKSCTGLVPACGKGKLDKCRQALMYILPCFICELPCGGEFMLDLSIPFPLLLTRGIWNSDGLWFIQDGGVML